MNVFIFDSSNINSRCLLIEPNSMSEEKCVYKSDLCFPLQTFMFIICILLCFQM